MGKAGILTRSHILNMLRGNKMNEKEIPDDVGDKSNTQSLDNTIKFINDLEQAMEHGYKVQVYYNHFVFIFNF